MPESSARFIIHNSGPNQHIQAPRCGNVCDLASTAISWQVLMFVEMV